MATVLDKLKDFRNWLNSEKFPASAYNYERNTIIAALEIIEQKIIEIEAQKLILSDDEPEEEMREGDIWFDIR
jgi:hypothetical protein